MEETFEDFDSDDQEFDDFSDDEIANVLELMGESGGSRLIKQESRREQTGLQASVRQEHLVEQPAASVNPFDAFMQSAMEEIEEVQVTLDGVSLEWRPSVAQTESSEKPTVTDFEQYFEDVYGSELSWYSSPQSLEKRYCEDTNLRGNATGFKSSGNGHLEEEIRKACVSSKSDFDIFIDRASKDSLNSRQDESAVLDEVRYCLWRHVDVVDLILVPFFLVRVHFQHINVSRGSRQQYKRFIIYYTCSHDCCKWMKANMIPITVV